MAEGLRSKCCSFEKRLGISSLQNDLTVVNWPSLTKNQQKKKLHQPGAVHKKVITTNLYVSVTKCLL